jgi:hypothetical protein
LTWKKREQTYITEGKKYVQDENRKIMRVRVRTKNLEERNKRRH